MRRGSLAAAALAVLAVSACNGKDQAMNADLAKDVALASTSSGLSLAPVTGAQKVISAEEQIPAAKLKKALSARSVKSTPHHSASHTAPVTPRKTTEVAAVSAPAPVEAPTPAPEPVTQPTPVADNTPAAPAPRPHPVDVATYPGTGSGSNGSHGSGIGIGDVIGAIGGVIIRGGVVDGDHCDPRGARRGRIGSHILINNRLPIPMPMTRGRF
jgi:hypothetical protein